jgi:hypothetical protein
LNAANAVHATDRDKEENSFTDQEKLADAEKGRRAREQFENDWEQGIRRARQTAKLCVLCGRPLSAIARLGGAVQHAGCKVFEE